MEHSANYLCYLATTGLVKCGKGVVTWFSAPANHIHSAAAFRIPQFCILPGPGADRVVLQTQAIPRWKQHLSIIDQHSNPNSNPNPKP